MIKRIIWQQHRKGIVFFDLLNYVLKVKIPSDFSLITFHLTYHSSSCIVAFFTADKDICIFSSKIERKMIELPYM